MTRILIVEDESIVAMDVQNRLTDLGYTVAGIADRGEEALALAGAHRPDLVLMDIRLKGQMDGITAAEQIRQCWHIPVIYLTAFSEDSTLRRAKVTEPFGYIIKPFEDREIQSTIEMALYKHQAEQQLRESERRYAATLTSIGDGVIATDAAGKVTFMNPVAENLTGWACGDARGRFLIEVFRIENEQTRQPVEDPVAKVLRENRVVGLANHTILISRDGRLIPIDDCAAPIFDDLGQITGTVLVFQDVSERRKAERQTQLSHQTLLTVLDGIDATIYVADMNSHEILFMNKHMIDAFGGDFTGRICYEVFRRESSPCGHCTNDRLLDAAGHPTEVCARETQNPITNRWYINHDRAIRWLDGRMVRLQIATDITLLKEMEQERSRIAEQLLQARKMESIGLLAGGVAHDLNNILSGIVSYPELILRDLDETSPMRRPLSIIKKSGEKAAAVVNDLLAIARSGIGAMDIVNLNDVIGEYLSSPEHKNLIAYHQRVHVDMKPEILLSNISGSRVHLSKILMNLVANAAEAMPEGGIVRIKTENICIDDRETGRQQKQPGDYVLLTVADSGNGIAPEDQERIFEPFFTRKAMGRSGTGLGMAIVWRSVADHRGYIDIESKINVGSTFRLYFPSVPDKQTQKMPAVPMDHYLSRGQTILIVDDMEDQRIIASAMLNRLGYSVVAASSGEQAIAYLKNHAVDLVILDMIMGEGLNGRETYERILAMNPNQKAVIASGFAESEDVSKARQIGASRFVQKPYTLETIGVAVKEALTGRNI